MDIIYKKLAFIDIKERLLAIMNHNKKSRFITVLSAFIIVLVIIGAIVLGVGVGTISTDMVSITTDINKYTSLMSSAQGITMTPNFKSDKKYTKLEYHWIAERGSFSSQSEVRNQVETVLWGGIEKNKIIDIKATFNIELEVIDCENQVVLAKIKLTIKGDGVFYEVSK